MKKILGISALLLAICALTAALNDDFLGVYNIQNLFRWTSLFGIIITGGIDLSIGSVVGLTGCLMPVLVIQQQWPRGSCS